MPYLYLTIKKLVITCTFIFCALFLFASEQIVFEQLSTRDGLSNGTVNSILKDSRGLMWFSTDDGLNRFDGYTFKHYNASNPDWTSDKSLQFLEIVEDRFGTIWIATSVGLYFFDRVQERIVHFLNHSDISLPDNLLNETINSIFYDSRDYLWVGTYNGIVRIKILENILSIQDENISLFQNYPDSKYQINNNVIYSITEDHDQNVWIASNSDYIESYNYENDILEKYKIGDTNLTHWNYLSKKITVDHDNNLWIATQGFGVIHWNRTENSFLNFQTVIIDDEELNISMVRTIMIDNQNRAWIGTDGNGIIIYDKKNNSASSYRSGANDHSKLSSNAIYSIFEDDNHIIWVGTYLTGVNMFVSNRLNFGVHYSMPNSTNRLNHSFVTNFCEDQNGLIWISTDGGGINVYDPKTGNFRHLVHEPNNKYSLSINAAITLLCDSDNKIWIGTYNGGLNIYDQEKEKFHHFWFDPSDSTSISSNHVWGFAQDKWGNMWVATVSSGLNLMKKGSDSFIRYQVNDNNQSESDHISSNAVTHLFIDNKNRLWIATEWGLNMVNLEEVDFSQAEPNLIFNHFFNPNLDTDIKEYRISYVTQDSFGNIWVGTRGAGIVKLDLETSNHINYNVDDGLPHNIVNGILFDENNNLWISTNSGLSNFDISSEQFTNYDTSYGLQSDFFMKTSCLKTTDGLMFFGGINGFNAFKPNEIIFENSYFEPIISDFRLFNQSVVIGERYNGSIILEKSIIETKEIILSYKDNDITFEFSALDYANPEKVLYSYKLEGFNNEWQMTDSKIRIAKYTNLDPGVYTFMVKASSNEDYWSDYYTSIQLIIKPPWWKTRIFIVLAVVSIIALLLFIYYYRIYSLQQQQIILQNTVDKKTKQLQIMNHDLEDAIQTKDKFFSIVAHDLISPFNSIMGLSDIMVSGYKEMDDNKRVEIIKMINRSSNELFDLLENLLQWSRTERGLLDYKPEKVILNEELVKIISLLSLSANRKGISIDTHFPKEDFIVKADAHLLSTVVRNLLSNAIKFTPKGGTILVKVEKHIKHFTVSIIDNGIGISIENLSLLFEKGKHTTTAGTNNEKGTGLGLMLVKEFVEKQGGSLSVKSKLGEGSTFSFTLYAWGDTNTNDQ